MGFASNIGQSSLPFVALRYRRVLYMPFYSNEEVLFSQMLRSARNQIECAFGRLKTRWQILQRPLGIASN